jgi:hypothetical protein
MFKISCTISGKCNILLEDRNFANRLEQRRSNLCDRLHIRVEGLRTENFEG